MKQSKTKLRNLPKGRRPKKESKKTVLSRLVSDDIETKRYKTEFSHNNQPNPLNKENSMTDVNKIKDFINSFNDNDALLTMSEDKINELYEIIGATPTDYDTVVKNIQQSAFYKEIVATVVDTSENNPRADEINIFRKVLSLDLIVKLIDCFNIIRDKLEDKDIIEQVDGMLLMLTTVYCFLTVQESKEDAMDKLKKIASSSKRSSAKNYTLDLDSYIKSSPKTPDYSTNTQSNSYAKGADMSNENSFFNADVKAGLITGGVAAAASLAFDYAFNPEKTTTDMAISAVAIGAAGGVAGYTASRMIDIEEPSMLKTAALTISTGIITAGIGKGVENMLGSTNSEKAIALDVPGMYD